MNNKMKTQKDLDKAFNKLQQLEKNARNASNVHDMNVYMLLAQKARQEYFELSNQLMNL